MNTIAPLESTSPQDLLNFVVLQYEDEKLKSIAGSFHTVDEANQFAKTNSCFTDPMPKQAFFELYTEIQMKRGASRLGITHEAEKLGLSINDIETLVAIWWAAMESI